MTPSRIEPATFLLVAQCLKLLLLLLLLLILLLLLLLLIIIMMIVLIYTVDRDRAVGIVTRYGLEGPRIESRWGRDFPHPPRPALGPTQPPVQGVPGVKRPGRGVDQPPHLAPRLKKEKSYTSTTPPGLS